MSKEQILDLINNLELQFDLFDLKLYQSERAGDIDTSAMPELLRRVSSSYAVLKNLKLAGYPNLDHQILNYNLRNAELKSGIPLLMHRDKFGATYDHETKELRILTKNDLSCLKEIFLELLGSVHFSAPGDENSHFFRQGFRVEIGSGYEHLTNRLDQEFLDLMVWFNGYFMNYLKRRYLNIPVNVPEYFGNIFNRLEELFDDELLIFYSQGLSFGILRKMVESFDAQSVKEFIDALDSTMFNLTNEWILTAEFEDR